MTHACKVDLSTDTRRYGLVQHAAIHSDCLHCPDGRALGRTGVTSARENCGEPTSDPGTFKVITSNRYRNTTCDPPPALIASNFHPVSSPGAAPCMTGPVKTIQRFTARMPGPSETSRRFTARIPYPRTAVSLLTPTSITDAPPRPSHAPATTSSVPRPNNGEPNI